MSEAKHTPGPWSALKSRTLINIKGPNGEQITQVSAKNAADAHLIAAAPELLEALREFCAVCPLGTVGVARAFQKASAVIAKAEGRS